MAERDYLISKAGLSWSMLGKPRGSMPKRLGFKERGVQRKMRRSAPPESTFAGTKLSNGWMANNPTSNALPDPFPKPFKR